MTSNCDIEYQLLWALLLLYGPKYCRSKNEKMLYKEYEFTPIFNENDRIVPKIPEKAKVAFEEKKYRLLSKELRDVKDPFAVKTQQDIVRLHFGRYYDEWNMGDYFGCNHGHNQTELMRGDSIKTLKGSVRSFRRNLADSFLQSDEKFYEIITDLIQLQEIILAHYECKNWTGEPYGLVLGTIESFFRHFDDPTSYIKKRPTLKNGVVKLYEELIVDNGVCRCQYAPAIAFLLLSTLMQNDFLPVYALISVNRYTESFQYALTNEVTVEKIETADYCISFNDAKNNFDQHYFANIEIEAHGKKRQLSDFFGNLVYQTGDYKIDFPETYCDNHTKKSIPCFVTGVKQFKQLKNGLLLVRFTTRDIPGLQAWFFELVIDQDLTVTAASSCFCFNRAKRKIKDSNHIDSRIFVRDEGPGAWGSSFTIPEKSWWLRYYSSGYNQTEEWYYADKKCNYTVCSSDEIIEIFTCKDGQWKWETVTAYFE